MQSRLLKLQCSRCKYKFKRDKIPARCPYCSKEGAVEFEKTAQDILDEVMTDIDETKRL